MYDVAIDWLSRRRRWADRYVRQLGTRLPGRPAESHPEIRVAKALLRAGVQGLVRQYPIDLPGLGRARFDLAVPRVRWALEVDVFPTHAETVGARRDALRDEAATSLGWTMHRLDRVSYETRFGPAISDAVASWRRTASAA
jgi:very-short-patch-repair endonuclease